METPFIDRVLFSWFAVPFPCAGSRWMRVQQGRESRCRWGGEDGKTGGGQWASSWKGGEEGEDEGENEHGRDCARGKARGAWPLRKYWRNCLFPASSPWTVWLTTPSERTTNSAAGASRSRPGPSETMDQQWLGRGRPLTFLRPAQRLPRAQAWCVPSSSS